MASGLAAFLRAEIDRRGWSDQQTAERAGIPKSNLSSLLNKPGVVPKLETLDRLAHALEIPLARLIMVTGFSVERDDRRTNDERIATMLEAVPELRGVIEQLLQLPPDDLRTVQGYVEYYLHNLKKQRAG
jgi:transcriptional regulator with XRE-family HTH domain